MRKSICILSFSNIAWDSRVLREITAAKPFYSLSVVGFNGWDTPQDVEFYQINKRGNNDSIYKKLWLLFLGKLNLKHFESYYWGNKEYHEAYELLKNKKFDLIHANDLNTLPLAIKLSHESGCKVLFDAHEYSPGQGYRNIISEFFFKDYRNGLLKRFGPSAHAMITVSEGIVELYRKNFNLKASVIYNAPNYFPAIFRRVDEDHIRIVHHGLAEKSRSLEEIIYLIREIKQNFTINFYLVDKEQGYLKELKDIVRINKLHRVKFYDPIKPHEIPRILNQYDLGIHLLKGTNLNHQNALPNKFFDFIMAGLGVVTYPTPMIEKIIKENSIGVVAQQNTVDSVVSILNSLTPQQINRFKKNSLRLAKTLNSENESKKLLRIYDQLIG